VWGRGSVPPDVVVSAEGLRVVRAGPRPAARVTAYSDLPQVSPGGGHCRKSLKK
jgi:hypothetical protein